jgi:hypothetical protein
MPAFPNLSMLLGKSLRNAIARGAMSYGPRTISPICLSHAFFAHVTIKNRRH